MTAVAIRRYAIIIPAWAILLSAAVLWWDAAANEGFSVRSISFAAAASLAGGVFLWIGRRRS
jgi:hypothetical protein